MKLTTYKFKKGQFLVELLIAIGLSALIIPALFAGFVAARESKPQEGRRLEAIAYMREAQDATRSVRERQDGWDYFDTNGTYHPEISGSVWELVSGPETIGDFTRSLEIEDVMRDSSGNIVTSGGTIDPSTKQITVTVLWSTPIPSSVSTVFYLTRFNSEVFLDTTEADFNLGTTMGTSIVNTAGGEVTLGAGGSGTWCSPGDTFVTQDLPKSGVANAVTAIEGRVFAGTGNNASGVSFADVDVTDTNPPVPSISGTFDGYKTNGVFGEEGYAYLATDNNFKEIVIIDLNQISGGKYTEVGHFNAPGNGDGDSIYVSGNVGYMVSGSNLYTFDLSSKSGSRPQIASAGLAGTGNRVFVVGSYAYVAVENSTTQMQIVEVGSGGSSLTVVGQANLTASSGKDVFVNETGSRAYVATGSSSTQDELFIVDISSKTGNRPTVGSYDTNGMDPKGVRVVVGNITIIVGSGAEEYQVVNILDENNPSRCGGIEVDSGVNGLDTVVEGDGDAYSYIITGDASSELKIIEGGPGGGVSTDGTFESQTFTTSEQVAFNFVNFTITEPVDTDIKFQLAVNDDNSTWDYFGPDGTNNTFYEAADMVPLSEVVGTYIRYKAFLEGDGSGAPVLFDFSIFYSP